jgi:hypothetical protein
LGIPRYANSKRARRITRIVITIGHGRNPQGDVDGEGPRVDRDDALGGPVVVKVLDVGAVGHGVEALGQPDDADPLVGAEHVAAVVGRGQGQRDLGALGRRAGDEGLLDDNDWVYKFWRSMSVGKTEMAGWYNTRELPVLKRNSNNKEFKNTMKVYDQVKWALHSTTEYMKRAMRDPIWVDYEHAKREEAMQALSDFGDEIRRQKPYCIVKDRGVEKIQSLAAYVHYVDFWHVLDTFLKHTQDGNVHHMQRWRFFQDFGNTLRRLLVELAALKPSVCARCNGLIMVRAQGSANFC